ncbi:MAG: COX15/CtaA family protein [Pseudomonadota bacterium]
MSSVEKNNTLSMYRQRLSVLAWSLVVLTWAIAMLGAYVRLTDAGLGCPDWPGCYGYWYVPNHPDQLDAAAQLYPHAPIESHKAWKEMAHRYAVSVLGLGILILFGALEWCARRYKKRWMSLWWEVLIIVWLVAQALFGMWTVTLKLMPIIVTGHLIGGVLLLVWLVRIAMYLSSESPEKNNNVVVSAKTTLPIILVWFLVLFQIFLGGWVSTNYAAGACGNSFPLCRESLIPKGILWEPALNLGHDLGYVSSGVPFPAGGLVAIHWMHRLGALIVAIAVIALALYLIKNKHRKCALLLLAVLSLQITLGFFNIYANLPLFVAVAHNGGATLLLAILTGLWAYSEQSRSVRIA